MAVRLALVLALLALAGCDTTADRPGEFEGTLSGAVSADVRWGGQFGDGMSLLLSDDEGGVTVDGFETAFLEPGRYPIGVRLSAPPSARADTFAAGLWLRPADRPTRSFVADSGELVLDAVSETEVRGSITFTATDLADPTQTVEVRGRFRAEYVGFCC